MSRAEPYNPLDKLSLAKSIEKALLDSSGISLSAVESIVGAGVYVLYYSGPFPAYAELCSANRKVANSRPIYVGKAIPKGGRKGGLRSVAHTGSKALAERLRQHAGSIREASNLALDDFTFRHLVLDDIWIPLGENMLIETFQPVWNRALDGFGNKDPGSRRKAQYKSAWDIVHPGRQFAAKLADPPGTAEFYLGRVRDYLAGKPPARLPKELEEQERQEHEDSTEAADNI